MRTPRTLATRPRLTLLATLAATLLAAGCGGCRAGNSPSTGLGARLEFGQGEVYYSAGIEESEALKVGEVLVREKYFGDRPATVQVRYQNRRYEVRCVVRAGVEQERSDRSWRKLGQVISTECFRNSPVDIHLADEHLKTLRTVPFEPMRPGLPVAVTFRSSIGGGSLVAQYTNTSSKYLTVSVVLRDPTLDQARTVVLNIGPNQTTEHGWVEGWSYKSGETITITHADFEVMELRVP